MAETRTHFDQELIELKDHLLKMGSQVAKATGKSVKALIEKNEKLAGKVIARDESINAMEGITDEKVIQLIAKQQPVAKDLRKVIIALKMNASLERMGDLALNIAKISLRLEKEISDTTKDKILEISVIIQDMVLSILEAYKAEDSEKAKEIALIDDQVDNLYKLLLNHLFSEVDTNILNGEDGTQLAFVARNLERIGDHVTNIAELLVYLEKAEKINLND